ncbi:MAG: TRAP transporter small permease [Candidatus Krumholzibacteriia bacterium]
MERPVLVYTLIVAGILALALVRTFLEKTQRWKRAFRWAACAEMAFITMLLAALIVFGCLQIVLRNFLHRGIIWADPLMRHIVLWLGCAGGVMATSRIRHISIDVLTRVLPERLHGFRDKVVYLATAVAASVLGMATLKLVIDEKAFGDKAFLNVDVWLMQSVLPVAFFLISYRSLLNMFLSRKAKPIDWEDVEEPP